MANELYEALAEIAQRRDGSLSSLVERFSAELTRMVGSAQARLIGELAQDAVGLAQIEATRSFQKRLRMLDSRFIDLLSDQGFDALLRSFVGSFDGQLPYFEETIRAVNEFLDEPIPVPKFAAKDRVKFAAMKVGAADNIEAAVGALAQAATNRAMLSIGALSYSALAEIITDEMGKSAGVAGNLGATLMSTYFRTVSNRGFEIIEQDRALLYTYVGPLDKLNRPFCRRMETAARKGKTWTRRQLEAMDNGSTLPNVFLHCGGWNCRHQVAVAGAS